MERRGIIKAVSALAVAAVMAVGMTATAFAAAYEVDGQVVEGFTFIAPDGSTLETLQIGGDTVYIVPLKTKLVLSEENQRQYDLYPKWDVAAIIRNNGVQIAWGDAEGLGGGSEFDLEELLKLSLNKSFDSLSENDYIEIQLINDERHVFCFQVKKQNSGSTSGVSSAWASSVNGKWIQHSDGSYLKNSWYQDADAKWYYMGSDGYMLTNTTTPDGFWVNAEGVWIQ